MAIYIYIYIFVCLLHENTMKVELIKHLFFYYRCLYDYIYAFVFCDEGLINKAFIIIIVVYMVIYMRLSSVMKV